MFSGYKYCDRELRGNSNDWSPWMARMDLRNAFERFASKYKRAAVKCVQIVRICLYDTLREKHFNVMLGSFRFCWSDASLLVWPHRQLTENSVRLPGKVRPGHCERSTHLSGFSSSTQLCSPLIVSHHPAWWRDSPRLLVDIWDLLPRCPPGDQTCRWDKAVNCPFSLSQACRRDSAHTEPVARRSTWFWPHRLSPLFFF